MLRILFISQYFHPEPFSNTAIAKELVRRGHQVEAVPCVPNYPSGKFFEGYSNSKRREEEWEGITIKRVRTYPRGSNKLSLVINYFTYPFAALWRIARSDFRDAQVSFVSMPSPLFQAFVGIAARKLWGIPTVYWVQDLWPETVRYLFNMKEGPLLSILDKICGWLYRKADIVMVQSGAMVPLVERHGVDRARIRVLPNTAPATFAPASAADFPEQQAMMPAADFRLMFAGNVGESQGLEVLVEAAALLGDRQDIGFVIVGSGRGMDDLKARIAEQGLENRFTFCGRHPAETMPGFFAQADAMLVSLKDFPNFALTVPYKLQNYFACGKPVIASIGGEGARIVDVAEAGISCPPEDARALADAILAMADGPQSGLDDMGRNARAYFEEHYAEDVVYSVLEDTLAEVARPVSGDA